MIPRTTILKLKTVFSIGLTVTLFSCFSLNSYATGIHHIDHYATGSTIQDSNTGLYDSTIPAPFSSDLDVNAMVSGGPEICYDLDIDWGIMMFEYDYGATWNPTTHSYSYTPGHTEQQGGWITETHVDSVHNKIHIKNNSNYPMKALFSYNPIDGAFNSDSSLPKSVTGIFSTEIGSLENDANVSLLMEGVNGINTSHMTSAQLTLEMDSENIDPGDFYYYAIADDSDKAEQDMIFALSGVPDPGLPHEYTPVGAISITITPATGVNKITKQ